MAIPVKTINGITEKTIENLLLDAGAFFKNYDVSTDTFETAKKANKLIGATKGGGAFKAVPKYSTIEIDGSRGKTKGMQRLEEWDISLSAKVVEVTADTLKDALCAAKVSKADTPANYTKVEGKNALELSDYIDNVTWVGTLSGSHEPVIIQIFNAFSEKGLELALEDKKEGVIPLEFVGTYDPADMDNPPFAIYYPSKTE